VRREGLWLGVHFFLDEHKPLEVAKLEETALTNQSYKSAQAVLRYAGHTFKANVRLNFT
jgi:hypothetical protein